MEKSGELSFLVIRLALVGDPLLTACKLRSYIHFSRIQQVGVSIEISDDDDYVDDDDKIFKCH